MSWVTLTHLKCQLTVGEFIITKCYKSRLHPYFRKKTNFFLKQKVLYFTKKLNINKILTGVNHTEV